MNCECSDPGCPACKGHCQKKATMCLVRCDMEDHTGTLFCDDCGADALESGVFDDSPRLFKAAKKSARKVEAAHV